MIQNTQLPEKATNQPCMESEQVNRLLCDPDKEYTTLTKRIIRISPKYPPYRIPDSELIPILFEIPYGMVVREEDLHEWIKKKYHVKFQAKMKLYTSLLNQILVYDQYVEDHYR